ncbi:MAG: hypothetical protein H6709_12305 [Kofleriaceae bacterium]|nr:hypothetical protein [Myxococcales bacterium]MCB9565399.1 hypothetical protein [Kofleriaceae bacterium]MCB9572860.1 hypothetical protein [Kofleriaceae bacterium]
MVVDALAEVIAVPRAGRHELDPDSGVDEPAEDGSVVVAAGAGFADVADLPWIRALAMRALTVRYLETGRAFHALVRLYQHAQGLGATPGAAALAYQARELDAWLEYLDIRQALTP